jgi:flavin-binding protein dodecin
MADIAKVITIIASKTLRGISGADVISMSAIVENDRISEYRTTVNIAFAIER